jgi:molecular chaperone DnaK
MNTPAVGIDLGTTFSVIAHLDASGRPCSISNTEGDILTPSAVLFDGSSVVVGKEAVKAAAAVPDDVALYVKREMGNPAYGRLLHGECLPPEVIQSFLLDKLRRDAALKLGEFTKAVISVPAFFNESRRKATQDAGALAELEVIDIINEPTAAALAYGVQQGFLTTRGEASQRENILVYDLGGGTFDVTLMEIDGKNYTAIATAGDVHLGGVDWDRRITDHLAAVYMEQCNGIDPRKTPAGLHRLLREAEDAKRTLSTREHTTITIEHEGNCVRVPVTRQEFEEMTLDLLDRTRFTVVNLLQDAQMEWSDITRLLLVGGSSRMPMVQRMLEEVSGKKPDRCLSADEAVAHGAAIYAGLILDKAAGSPPKVTVRNVNSHNLGVLGTEKVTGRPRNRVMIPRNCTLPAIHSARFVTRNDNQTNVAVNVVEGGDASGNDATPIGKCVVRDLPPGLPAGTPVEVTFRYGENGRLTVMARLPIQDKEASSEIERTSGMTPDMLRGWNQRIHKETPLPLSASATSSSSADDDSALPQSLSDGER